MTTLFNQPKGSRTLLAVEILFMLIGFVFLGWAGYATAERLFYGSWQDYKFEVGIQRELPTLMGYLEYLRAETRPLPIQKAKSRLWSSPQFLLPSQRQGS